MTCELKEYIYIFKGDDTNWNNEQFLTVNITSQTIDLSTMTAKFILGSFSQNFPLTTGSFEINLSKAVTGAYSFGPINGVIQILDSESRVKTVSNTIPFYVTNKVQDAQNATFNVQVSENSPIEIDIQVGGGGGGSSEWGQITGTLSDQTDLQDALNAKMNTSGGTFTGDVTLASGVSLNTQVGQIHDVNDNVVLGGKGTNYGLYVAPDGSAAALVGNGTLKDILTTDNVKSTYSATGTDPVNGTAVASAISPISAVIPSAATSQNQLADKNFVNSSVSTNTANFIGTFNSVADLEAYSGTLTNNDYAFVISTDSAGNTVYNRYKYSTATTPAAWQFEYALNNSSFTADQWAAINSGATTTNIGQIATNTTAIAAKQPKTLDTPITVGGVSQTTVEGALGAINTNTDGALKNTATGTNSLTILGTATAKNSSINIGNDSKASGTSSTAIGWSAEAYANYTLAAGNGAVARGLNSVCLGAGTNDYYNKKSTVVGSNSHSSAAYGISIGTNVDVTGAGAIQIGNNTDVFVTNPNPKTLQVYEYQLLDGTTGLIPSARIPTASSSVKGGIKLDFDSATGVLNIITE